MLKLISISHSYEAHDVLKFVNLNLKPGDRIALMGPSGCGKTTLLRIALGLLKPTEGTVENTFSKTAAVFQEPRLLPWRTALENVNLVLGDSKATMEKARAALVQMQLEEAAKKYPRDHSRGFAYPFLLHQLAYKLGVGGGVFQRQVGQQLCLTVQQLRVILRGSRIADHSLLQRLHSRMLRI